MLFFGGLLSAFILSLLLTYIGSQFFVTLGLVDTPGTARKKHHTTITPLGGGVAIILSTLFIGALIEWQFGVFTEGAITYGHLAGLFIASIVILAYGLLDDKKDLRPRIAILGPLLVAVITVLAGFEIVKITHPFGGEIAIMPIVSAIGVFVWLLVIMYSLKVADGVDGLVGSIGMSSAFMIAILASSDAYFQPDVALMALIVLGAIGGFLVFNWNPATIFLGESGSVWIGYAIAILAIISGSKLLTALMVLALPIIDLLFVMTRRLLARKSLWAGDRLHLHHLLLDQGWKHQSIVFLYVATSLGLGVLSLLLESWQKIGILLILGALIFVRFVFGWYAEQKS